MRKLNILFIAAFIMVLASNCKTTKEPAVAIEAQKLEKEVIKAEPVKMEKPIEKQSYAKDIAPFIKTSCAPCHFTPDGKKEPLDSYNALKSNITTVIRYIKLPIEDENYMPFKSKKPAISPENIAKLEQWLKEGMKE